MALTLKDRVLETAAAPGTGAVTLLGAVTGYQTFSAAIGNGNTCYYTIADQSGSNWEVGIGTYSSSGNTLARTTVLSSSNAGSTVNFASGTQNVFVTYPAEEAVYSNGTNIVGPSGIPLAVSSGGTGLTTLTSGYIPYGNGTSAFSSSSAFSFDGSNLTLSTSQNSATKVNVTNSNSGTSAVARYEASNGSNTAEFGIRGTSQSTNGILAPQVGYAYSPSAAGLGLVAAAGPILFASNGTSEVGRFSPAGYLGIGTSSPSYPLQVQRASDGGIAYFRDTSGSNQPALYIKANDASNVVGFDTDYALSTSPAINFSMGGSEKMRLDSSGNLGLGVTPSAWGGNNKAIEGVAYGSGQFYLASGASGVVSNAYNNGTNWIYKTTQYATNYWQFQGQHLWYNAPSGTAGNAITFTQAMTLNNSGQLLVGTTTAYGSSKLVVCPTTTPTSGTDGNTQIQIGEATSNTGYHLNLGYGNFSGSYYGYIQAIAGGSNTPLLLQPSGGYVGIGTSSPASLLNVVGGRTYLYGNSEAYALKLTYNSSTAGFYLGSPSANTLSFSNDSGTEFARIDSSGNLGLGVTPSAWSGKTAYQAKIGSFVGDSSATYFSSNWFYGSGGDTYIGNGYASQYVQYGGLHAWKIAPSGTAGNAITFTQAMTLDNSGNLLVGTTSAYNGAKASINGDIEAHGNFKTHYGNYTSSLTNGSSLTLMTYGNGSYGSPINGILTVFVRDDSGGNLQMTSVLLVGLGGAGAAFTALTTQPYGAGMAFSFGSSASSGSLTIYITNTSGRTATSVNFEFMALYGGANITYAF